MSRLIASGCSCTRHCWPTWADYLGKHFDEYVNVATGGADNAVIARNVIATARHGDTVVIQWTGFDRFNTFTDDEKQKLLTPNDLCAIDYSGMDVDNVSGGWQHHGSIWGPERYKKFVVNYYHPVERFRHSLDYVKMVEMHSHLTGYRVWNFSMANWFLSECESKNDPRLLKMHERMKFRHFYLDHFLLDIRDEVAPLIVKHKYANNDNHPTPLVNWVWLKEYMAPEIGISLDFSIEDQVQYDQERVLKGDVD